MYNETKFCFMKSSSIIFAVCISIGSISLLWKLQRLSLPPSRQRCTALKQDYQLNVVRVRKQIDTICHHNLKGLSRVPALVGRTELHCLINEGNVVARNIDDALYGWSIPQTIEHLLVQPFSRRIYNGNAAPTCRHMACDRLLDLGFRAASQEGAVVYVVDFGICLGVTHCRLTQLDSDHLLRICQAKPCARRKSEKCGQAFLNTGKQIR